MSPFAPSTSSTSASFPGSLHAVRDAATAGNTSAYSSAVPAVPTGTAALSLTSTHPGIAPPPPEEELALEPPAPPPLALDVPLPAPADVAAPAPQPEKRSTESTSKGDRSMIVRRI